VANIDLDRLMLKGRLGTLDPGEQAALVAELEIYRAMALRLERALHELIKEAEG